MLLQRAFVVVVVLTVALTQSVQPESNSFFKGFKISGFGSDYTTTDFTLALYRTKHYYAANMVHIHVVRLKRNILKK